MYDPHQTQIQSLQVNEPMEVQELLWVQVELSICVQGSSLVVTVPVFMVQKLSLWFGVEQILS
jgi:protein involved in temperature-dependent protein secretion